MRAQTEIARNMPGAFHLELSRHASNELEVVWWRLGRLTTRSLPLFNARDIVPYEPRIFTYTSVAVVPNIPRVVSTMHDMREAPLQHPTTTARP